MTDHRAFLVAALRRIRDGGTVENEELLGTIPDPCSLNKIERAAWYCLSRWADDDDIRAKDARYVEIQQRQIGEALGDLEALEAGYLPSEVSKGEHQAWHLPLWGCALLAVASFVGLYFLVAFLI